MNKFNVPLVYLKDFYKVDHINQYPKGTDLIFNNFTPRKSIMDGVDYSIFFGLKYFIKEYLEEKNKISSRSYSLMVNDFLGIKQKHIHIDKLLDLEYWPIKIYALPELSKVPEKVPALVIFNTHPDFFWLPNMLETILSCTLWGACNSATIAHKYRTILDFYANQTSDNLGFVDYQAHDFSFRGMFGLEAACISGMAHLQYFKGTDTIPAMICNMHFYDAIPHVSSVPATEHSVMSAGGSEEGEELETYRRLIEDIYPSGIISIVSDTWDLWKVIKEILPSLKEKIMKRDGKIVIRPDSGDPVGIICGSESEKGVVELLWDIFGGKENSKGFKELDSHIGVIYGDSITIDRCRNICELLKQKGFASTNVVFGIGSYSYQYNTRDTLGWAMKATYAEINGVGRPITKNPITDSGMKKSASGILKVVKVNQSHGYTYKVLENQTWDQFYQKDNELKLVFDGHKYIN